LAPNEDKEMKKFFTLFMIFWLCTVTPLAQESAPIYKVGVGDILNISVIQPQEISVTVTVAPDGTINYPYIGLVHVQGLNLAETQEIIQKKLAEGYMHFPVVSVILQESRSRRYFVYGEVQKPGTYPLDDKTTVLKAISVAGGLTKFGSTSRVQVLRENETEPGYKYLKVNIKALMEGAAQEDLLIQPGDIIVISESGF
jgi:polysaccharide export outer membrane protein